MRVFVGTYPAPAHANEPAQAEGIWRADFDVESGQFTNLTQVNEVPAASYLAVGTDDQELFAVSETEPGNLFRFAITDAGLEHRQTVPTFGIDPCHVAIAAEQVVVTNYTSGSVASYRSGHPGAELVDGKVFQQSGSGPNTDRQAGPHAHFSAQIPTTQHVWVTDLGADRIIGYQITSYGEGTRQLVARGTAVEFPVGSGPRHIAFDGDSYAFVVGELNNTLYTVRIDELSGKGEIVNEHVLVGTVGPDTPSHLEINPEGTLLFVAVRGIDNIQAFAIVRSDQNNTGAAPTLEPVGVFSAVGQGPRHFKTFGQRSDGLHVLAVANKKSGTLDVLGFDQTTGTGQLLSQENVPAPACIVNLN